MHDCTPSTLLQVIAAVHEEDVSIRTIKRLQAVLGSSKNRQKLTWAWRTWQQFVRADVVSETLWAASATVLPGAEVANVRVVTDEVRQLKEAHEAEVRRIRARLTAEHAAEMASVRVHHQQSSRVVSALHARRTEADQRASMCTSGPHHPRCGRRRLLSCLCAVSLRFKCGVDACGRRGCVLRSVHAQSLMGRPCPT